ncbi:MAG: deoxyribodipyrimidine photo-lyase [Acidocella sp.]|nr:deoxyribodipyrimidine photo-lyase [Acidocella sp.]
MNVNIVWFKNDLRLADNPALHAALQSAERILPVFVLDDHMPAIETPGGASRWWLHHSLSALAADLRVIGAELVLRRGEASHIIPALALETGASAVHTARAHEPAMRAVDKQVATALQVHKIEFHRHLSAALFAPERITTKTGGVYGVYTPFSRACFDAGVSEDELPVPTNIPGVRNIASDDLSSWALLPTQPDWAQAFPASWQPGEAGAHQKLAAFLQTAVGPYADARNLPGQPGTSRLSPHLHFGEISPRTVWNRAVHAKGQGVQTYLKELLWREFSMYLLWHHPNLASVPIRSEFANFPWADDRAGLRAWQRGQTGIPIVDAGMRELWQTGWMHNRVRMIVASFLVKHLLIPWQVGEAWFWDTLVDADLAANAASWQWVAGCGADAAPYFRIFNPVLQGQKFDADGTYVRRYIPELAALPNQYIHAPWDAPEIILTSARVTLGRTYPKPLITLTQGRERALAAYRQISKSGQHD